MSSQNTKSPPSSPHPQNLNIIIIAHCITSLVVKMVPQSNQADDPAVQGSERSAGESEDAADSGSNNISPINNNRSYSSIRGAIVNRRMSRIINRQQSQDRLAELDDEEGKSEFFLILLIESLDDEIPWFIKNTLLLTVWAALCAYFSSWLRDMALQNPGGREEVWLQDIENCNSAISILGTLFVFTLVFRFNSCYDRWWGE